MVPESPQDDGAALSRAARRFWRDDWAGRSLMVVGAQDPVLGPPTMQALHKDIHGCPDPWIIEEAGHFVQEHGQPIAERALIHFARG